jgi:hypothetical protein
LSFTISPPAGAFVAAVTPASRIASALAKFMWPLAWVRSTGLFGDTRLRAVCGG